MPDFSVSYVLKTSIFIAALLFLTGQPPQAATGGNGQRPETREGPASLQSTTAEKALLDGIKAAAAAGDDNALVVLAFRGVYERKAGRIPADSPLPAVALEQAAVFALQAHDQEATAVIQALLEDRTLGFGLPEAGRRFRQTAQAFEIGKRTDKEALAQFDGETTNLLASLSPPPETRGGIKETINDIVRDRLNTAPDELETVGKALLRWAHPSATLDRARIVRVDVSLGTIADTKNMDITLRLDWTNLFGETGYSLVKFNPSLLDKGQLPTCVEDTAILFHCGEGVRFFKELLSK